MSATYKNPWHNPHDNRYGPVFFEANVRPVEYNGHLIYQRVKGTVWDVVKDGVCVTQRAGMDGAKRAIDQRTSA